MQMGRWFGFRPGYGDLVRVFLGVSEGKGDSDLVALFKEVCRMEERFREEIKRYVRRPERNALRRSKFHLDLGFWDLPPTARNKMFNAVLAHKNFGGQWSMLTLTASEPTGMEKNIETMRVLLEKGTPHGRPMLGGTKAKGKAFQADAVVVQATNEQLITFLRDYRWLETDFKYPDRPADTALQIDFLENEKHDISTWLIIAPQRKTSFGAAVAVARVGEMTVKERHREDGRGFQVFGEP